MNKKILSLIVLVLMVFVVGNLFSEAHRVQPGDTAHQIALKYLEENGLQYLRYDENSNISEVEIVLNFLKGSAWYQFQDIDSIDAGDRYYLPEKADYEIALAYISKVKEILIEISEIRSVFTARLGYYDYYELIIVSRALHSIGNTYPLFGGEYRFANNYFIDIPNFTYFCKSVNELDPVRMIWNFTFVNSGYYWKLMHQWHFPKLLDTILRSSKEDALVALEEFKGMYPEALERDTKYYDEEWLISTKNLIEFTMKEIISIEITSFHLVEDGVIDSHEGISRMFSFLRELRNRRWDNIWYSPGNWNGTDFSNIYFYHDINARASYFTILELGLELEKLKE